MLHDLGAALQSDLKCDIYQKHLMKYAFFRLVSSLTPGILPGLCQCVTDVVVHPCDEVFKPGAESNAVHFVVQGSLRYLQEPMTSAVIQTQHTTVAECAWVSEAAFWIQWIHVGSLRAIGESKLITFDALGVVEGLVKDRVTREVSCLWAKQFHQCVCEARPPPSDFPTDLVVPNAEFCEIISRMGEEFRTWSGHASSQDDETVQRR